MMMDKSKMQTLQEWPALTDVTAVWHFLDLASYYRHYILKFAEVASPLHALTQKGVPFSWTVKCQQAFLSLKDKLV